MGRKTAYLDGASNQTTLNGASRIATAIYDNSGVINIGNNDMKVVERGAGANASVDVTIGQIVIGRDAYTNTEQDSYFFGFTDTTQNVVITANTSGNPRIDAIVVYVDETADGATDNDNSLFFIAVAGTPAGSPSAPTDATIQTAVGVNVRWYRLANVAVANGFVSIVNANITDTREQALPRGGSYAVQVYTSSNTWTKPLGLRSVLVEVQAGGGGGGSGVGAGSGQGEAGGGGGGGYSRKLIQASALGATETVTVGAGGAGGASSGANNGITGGTSSFGAHCSATGGTGGTADAVPTTGTSYEHGGNGGTGSSGDVNVTGGDGGGGRVLAGAAVIQNYGGGSVLGNLRRPSSSAAADANDGYDYGGGGTGAFVTTTKRAGGDGGDGVVIVHEYY